MLKLLHGAGMRVFRASPIDVEWVVPGCDDTFHASYEGGEWIIQSKEWNGVRWIECDDRVTQVALGAFRRAA